VWLAQRRGQRYAFHLSGRQRAECLQEGPWEGPACTRLVLIGQQREALLGLRRGLLDGCRAGACGCGAGAGRQAVSAAAAEFARRAAAHPRFQVRSGSRGSEGGGGCGGDGADGGSGDSGGSGTGGHGNSVGDRGAGSSGGGAEDVIEEGLVEFSCEAVPLQGVVADVVG
jgi:hypothetical protein